MNVVVLLGHLRQKWIKPLNSHKLRKKKVRKKNSLFMANYKKQKSRHEMVPT